MPKKPETLIVERIIRYIKDNGGDAWHVHGGIFQRTGEPDIDGWLPGCIHLKIEVKQPGGKPEPLQEYRLRKYRQAGYCAGCVDSVEQFQKLVEEYKLCGFGHINED